MWRGNLALIVQGHADMLTILFQGLQANISLGKNIETIIQLTKLTHKRNDNRDYDTIMLSRMVKKFV